MVYEGGRRMQKCMDNNCVKNTSQIKTDVNKTIQDVAILEFGCV